MLSVLGLLVVVACAAGGAAVARGIDRSKPYLVVEQFVPAGQVLTAADLRSAEIVAPSELGLVPTADAGAVVGHRLAVTVMPGSLLSAGDLAGLGPQSDFALVGTSLGAAQMPGTLQVGDPVLVVLDATGATPSGGAALPSGAGASTGSSGAGASTGSSAGASGAGASASGEPASNNEPPGNGVLCQATVEQISSPSQPGGTAGSETVTLAVPQGSAAAVSQASSEGAISLAELPLRARAS